MARFCTNCGGKLPDGARFCGSCGAAVPNAGSDAIHSGQPAGTAPAAPAAEKPAAAGRTVPERPASTVKVPVLKKDQTAAGSTVPERPASTVKVPVLRKDTEAAKAAAAAAENKKKKGKGKRAFILFLALCVFFYTAFENPGFLKGGGGGGDPTKPVQTKETASQKYVDESVPIGSSKALSLEVEKGVTVSAPKNALYKGETLKVTPVTEKKPEVLEVMKDLRASGEYAFAAWEVDAGLKPDEHLPGEFEMKVDLAEFDIPKELYGCVRFYRVTEDGDVFAYETEQKGSVISFTSNQNSIILSAIVIERIVVTVVGVTVGLCVNHYIAKCKAEKYYTTKPGEAPCTLEGDTGNGKFTLMFFSSDVDPEFGARIKRMREIEEQVRKPIEEEFLFEADRITDLYRMNRATARDVNKALAENEEYKALQKAIATPAFITKLIGTIGSAYRYLAKEARVEMPKYQLNIYLKTKLDALGYQVSQIVGKSYVEIDVQPELVQTVETGSETWDDLLLTLAHEIFHICQENYHTAYFTDSQTFDEMAAVLLEYDAFTFFTKEKTIRTTPGLLIREPAYLDMLDYPMDYVYKDKDEKIMQQRNQAHGYCMGQFVLYLRDKMKNQVTPKQLMDARRYAWPTNVSDPIRHCFALPKDALESYFKAFVMDHDANHDNRVLIADAMNRSTVIPARSIMLDNGQAKHFTADFTGPLQVRHHKLLLRPTTPTALLIVPDKNFDTDNPGAVILPSEEYKRISKGIYIPHRTDGVRELGAILEIIGNDYNEKAGDGFTVYTIPTPEVPKVEVKDGKIYLALPEACQVYKDGLAAGYRVEFIVNGQKKTASLKAENFGKTVNIELSKILPKGAEGEVEIAVRYCPVLSFDDKDLPVGPESPMATVWTKVEVVTTEAAPTGEPQTEIHYEGGPVDISIGTYSGEFHFGGSKGGPFSLMNFWDMENHDPDVYADAQATFSFDGKSFSLNVPARAAGGIGGEKFIYGYDAVPAITVSGSIEAADFSYSVESDRISWSCYDAALEISPQAFSYTHRYGSDGKTWREEYRTTLEFSPASVQKETGRGRVQFSLNRKTGELLVSIAADCHWKTEYANGSVEQEFQEQVHFMLDGTGYYR